MAAFWLYPLAVWQFTGRTPHHLHRSLRPSGRLPFTRRSKTPKETPTV